MKLTKVQKTTRFIVHSIGSMLLFSLISGLLPAVVIGQTYQILGI